LLQSGIYVYANKLGSKSRIERWRGDKSEFGCPSTTASCVNKRGRKKKKKKDLLIASNSRGEDQSDFVIVGLKNLVRRWRYAETDQMSRYSCQRFRSQGLRDLRVVYQQAN